MAERLHAVLREFKNAADVGTPSDQVGNVLHERVDQLARIELPDLESEPLRLQPESLDLAVSRSRISVRQRLAGRAGTDPPRVETRRAVAGGDDRRRDTDRIGGNPLRRRKPNAKAGSRPASRRLPICAMSVRCLQRAGFALPVTDVDRVVVRYTDAFALMQDLRRMGATNILRERRRTPTRRATMLRMAQIYGERFADPDGRIRATFDVIWLSGWAPHESQQQPLRPGSAKASLAEAVKKPK